MKGSFCLVASITLIVTTVCAQADESVCKVPLSAALMTVRGDAQSTGQSAAATAWQCSFKFSNHDEAISAGLQVGTFVYGVPLKVGGTFDKKAVTQWKEDNCSRNTSNSSFEEATVHYLRQVAPGAMSAFASCIAAHQDRTAVTCSVTRDSGSFQVSWRRLNGEPLTSAPIVKRFLVANGACQSGLATNTPITEGGIGTICTPIAKKDLVVMVQTSRGLCTAVAPYQRTVYPIVGPVELTSDKQINADIVEFRNGGKIVTNGHSLTINAGDIKLDGNGEIVAFDGTPRMRPPGTPGRSGGSALVKTGDIEGADLQIDLTGEAGAGGADGANGTKGTRGGNAQGRGLIGLRGCGGGHDATPGGPGTPGGDAGNGGNGGNGGVVVIQLSGPDSDGAMSHLDIVGRDGATYGGAGGAAGHPGKGGPGGDGGSGDSGSDGCGGRGGAGPGPNGSDGKPGTPGRPGAPGSIAIQQ